MADSGSGKQKLKFYDFFQGKLIFTSPLHIGCSQGSMETDNSLLRDAGGIIYIPGSSIIGPLRARACELFPDHPDLIKKIFGYQEKENGTQEGSRSRLMVEDAYPVKIEQPTNIRDGVGIDRKYESASPGCKYDLETTARDIQFHLNMRLVLREDDLVEEMRYIVFTVINELRDGKIKLGGMKSRGLGRCRFQYTARTLDFKDRDRLKQYLLERKIAALPRLREKHIAKTVLKMRKPSRLCVSLNMLAYDSPFIIKHAWDDDDYDAVFTRTVKVDGKEIEYVPGSSIKGVFRAKAEKIVRTLGGRACDPLGNESCSASIKQAIGNDEIDPDDEDSLKNSIESRSCMICRLFGNGYLGSRITFDDAFFDSYPDIANKEIPNVAISRFDGGAIAGKLFDAYPVVRGLIRFNIEIENPTNFDKVLLLLILRDLFDGKPPLPIGYGKSKAYGILKCDEVSIRNGIAHSKVTDLKKLANVFDHMGVSLDNWWEEKASER